ncbi:MAG: hypothetical protein WEC33_05135 [Dehalococcoidia bacterium]
MNVIAAARLLTLTALGALVAPVFIACGSDGGADSVEAADWVEAFCDRLTEFDEAADEIAEPLPEIDLAGGEDAKDEIVEIVEDVIAEAEALAADLGEIGQPDVDGGADIRSATIAHADEVVDRLEDLLDEISDHDPGSETFAEDMITSFEESEEGGYRARLEDLDDTDGAADIIDLIEDEGDCADAAFPEDDDNGSSDDDEPGDGDGDGDNGDGDGETTGDSTDPEAWVAAFCTSVVSYGQDIEILATSLFGLQDFDDLEEVRDLVVGTLEEGADRSYALALEISEFPDSDLDNSGDIRDTFIGVGETVGDIFSDSADDISAIDVTDEQAFIDGLDAVGLTLNQIFLDLEDTLGDLQSDEFDEIAADLPECFIVQ